MWLGSFCSAGHICSIHRSSYSDDHRVTAGRARSTLAFHSRMSRPALFLMLPFRREFFAVIVDPREEEVRLAFSPHFALRRNLKYFSGDVSRPSIVKLGCEDSGARACYSITPLCEKKKGCINI